VKNRLRVRYYEHIAQWEILLFMWKDASMNYLQSAATIPLHNNFLFTYNGPLLITLRDKGNSYSWQFGPAISFNFKWISLLKCTLVEYLLTDMHCKKGPIHMHCVRYPHSFPSPTFTLSARKDERVTLLTTFHQLCGWLSTWTIFIRDLWYSVLFYDVDVIGVHVFPKFLLANFDIDITRPFLNCWTVM